MMRGKGRYQIYVPCFIDYSGFGFGSLQNKFHIRDVLPHPLGEPNRIRTMPQNCCIIASISSSGSVKVMNLPSFQYPNLSEDIERTYVHLIGHQQEGWALDWSSTETGRLATGSDDMLICTWDLQGQPLKPSCQPLEQRTQSSLYPTLTLRGHKAAVQDVAWHPIERNLLFSSGDDGTYKIWDIRSSSSPQIDNLTAGGGKPLNSIAVNKYHPELFATGGEEQDVVLWDTRNPSEEVYRLSYGHTSCISRIAWGNSERYLASCAGDRLVLVWDLYSIGKETTLNESEDGPPELLFTHAGHTDCVYDFSWNPNETEAVMLASVSQDNELHVWKMEDEVLESDELYSTDDDEFEVE